MRWLFLLLLMLNGLYYLWHQQEAPLKAKEVFPLSLHRAEQQNIHLLSESEAGSGLGGVDSNIRDGCLYLGGFQRREQALTVEQRLLSLDVRAAPLALQFNGANTFWIKIDPVSRRLVGEGLVKSLVQDFPELKSKIMLCEGIATAE